MNNSTYIIHPDGERDPRGCVRGCLFSIIAIIIVAVTCICFTSCASTKNMEKVETTESSTTNVEEETTGITKDETSHHEEHSTTTTQTGTEITFGAGGGTYNSRTGEATNVAGVKENTTLHEQEDKIADLSSRIAYYQHSVDSLSALVNTYCSELEQEKSYPKRSGWDRFCTWWFIGTALFLIVKIAAWFMEKNPTTAPCVAVVRKFIPFL